jgi:hypothetical protein
MFTGEAAEGDAPGAPSTTTLGFDLTAAFLTPTRRPSGFGAKRDDADQGA